MENKYKKLLLQASKFVTVGFLNTGIDFAVLNLLIYLTGINKGGWIILLNAVSFSAAVTNSYILNKFWTFKSKEAKDGKVTIELPQFLAVSLVGLAINSSLVYLITTYIPPFFGISGGIWANFAKACATGLSLVWNFLGYKFIVFKGH